MKVDNGTLNFRVYEDATVFYGMAEVALPEISLLAEEIKGGGIAGAFSGVFMGHTEAMSTTILVRGRPKHNAAAFLVWPAKKNKPGPLLTNPFVSHKIRNNSNEQE